MSPSPRLFVKAGLANNQQILPDASQAHYLFSVMRLRTGDTVRLFNGQDGEWSGLVTENKALLLQKELRPHCPSPDIELWCPPLRPARSRFLIEKATELGVARIQHIITLHTCRKNPVRLDRLRRIAIEAAEQTERLNLPAITEPRPLADALDTAQAPPIIFCDEAGDEPDCLWGGSEGRAPPMAEVLRDTALPKAAILIGPEGGFSPEERKRLRQSPAIIPVSLGPNILRTETACLAALTLWQALRGDWR